MKRALPVLSASAPAPRLIAPEGHGGSAFVVSVSGGKDSTAVLLAMIDAGIPFVAVFADTGWEHPATYEYLATLERTLGLRILRVGAPDAMRSKIRARAGFPARKVRWCTSELKVLPIKEVHAAVGDEGDVVSVVGMRAEESEARAKLPEFELDDKWGGYVWRPLIAWSIEQVLAIHHRFGVPVNPLYRLGFNRVGCFPCIYASKADIKLTAEVWPERIDEIEALEAECASLRAARNDADPGRYKSVTPTFFHIREVDRYEHRDAPATVRDVREGRALTVGETIHKRMPVWRTGGIRRAVAWARGIGSQQVLFDAAPSGGCFRWGLCDAPPAQGGTE